MVERDVNPLSGRHMALSVRFKAAWAFHQLLVGMHRIQILEQFDDRADGFKGAFSKLKQASEKLNGPETSDTSKVPVLLAELEAKINELVAGLTKTDDGISPSQLRQFFQQVRSFDERILIDIVHFYQYVVGEGAWNKDRLDKVDLVVSRLAESIAGADLQGDRNRLRKVLQALAVVENEPTPADAAEISSLSATLQDLRSEVRWVKTFDELEDSKLVQLYRALKHDMGRKFFHPHLLPLIADVNNAFKAKVAELRAIEEDRIVSSYQKLLTGPGQSTARGAELDVALASLQRQLDDFQTRVKTDNVRLDSLARLGKSLNDVARRFEARLERSAAAKTAELRSRPARRSGPIPPEAEALVPNLDAVQPFWEELMTALSGLDPKVDALEASSQGGVLKYRLEPREVAAYRALVRNPDSDESVNRFLLAAVALRRRVSCAVEDVQGVLSEAPGTMPEAVLEEALRAARMADAYVKHFSYLVDQAVFDSDLDSARSFQVLEMRFMREYSGLLNLIPRLLRQTSLEAAGFPVVAEDEADLSAGIFGKPAAPDSTG